MVRKTWLKSLFSMCLIASLSTGSPAAPSSAGASSLPFKDISSSYAKEEITELYHQQVVIGVGDARFEPKRPVSREEFMTMLGKSIGLEPLSSEVAAFSDVPKPSWSYGWVQAGNALGLIKGTSEVTFTPKSSIRREEAAAILVRAIHKGENPASNLALNYLDSAHVSPWARSFVQAAREQGLMSGYEGKFRPQDPVTREEMAILLKKLLDKQEGEPSGKASQIFLGWQYASKGDDFKQRVHQSALLNTVSPRWFMLNKDGTIGDSADLSLVDWAHKQGYKVWALVGNRFDAEASHQVLSQPDQRKEMVQTLTALATKYKLDGLNIDFEGLYPKDRDAYTAFISELGAALRPLHITLSVDIPPDLDHEWSDPFDYAALGKHADYLVLMGYDEHWATSPAAGSVASLPWLERGIERLISDVPASKVIVGLPLYTRDWKKENNKVKSSELLLHQQSKLLSGQPAQTEWDPKTGQYVATYQKNGVTHTIWTEESRSLALKYQIAIEKGVAGVAFWSIGGETPDVWTSLRNVLKFYSK